MSSRCLSRPPESVGGRADNVEVDVRHGTQSGYRTHKCRCDECRAWKSATAKRYNERHREQAVERVRRWRAANPERRREQGREYVERNRDDHNRRGREWHRNNYERSRERQRAYWQTEAGKANRRAANFKRRAGRLRNCDELAKAYLLAIAADPCAYCGGPADTVDHKTPLSRGGTNEWWNLAAACRSCNSRKHNKTVEEFTSASLPTPGLADTA